MAKYLKALITLMFPNLRLNKSLDQIKILTFWEILKTGNILLLDAKYKENKYYSKKSLAKIKETFSKLYDEYFKLRDDFASKEVIKNKYEALKYARIITHLKQNIDFLLILKKHEKNHKKINITELEYKTYDRVKSVNSRIKIEPIKGIDYNVGIISKFILSLTNRLNEINANQKKTEKKEVSNFYETVAYAESWLERSLDVNNMVVSHWVALEKQIQQKIQAYKKTKRA